MHWREHDEGENFTPAFQGKHPRDVDVHCGPPGTGAVSELTKKYTRMYVCLENGGVERGRHIYQEGNKGKLWWDTITGSEEGTQGDIAPYQSVLWNLEKMRVGRETTLLSEQVYIKLLSVIKLNSRFWCFPSAYWQFHSYLPPCQHP